MHSSYSHDVPDLPELSPRALYDKAVALGMDYFILTDHDTMKGVRALVRDLRQEFGDQPPIPVIPGVELKVRDPLVGHTVHVNVLGLTAHHLRELGRRRRSMPAFLEFCRAQGLYHAYNHPFWFERGERPDLKRILTLMAEFPVVELNAGRIPAVNERTARLAWRCRRHLVAGSDSHTGHVARAYTLAPGDTTTAFLANLQRGRSLAVPEHLIHAGFMAEIRHLLDLVFEGASVFRFKRTLLSQAPGARLLARALLGTRRLMGARLFNTTVRVLMLTLAHAPAWAYIQSQRWMNLRMGRAEARLARQERAARRVQDLATADATSASPGIPLPAIESGPAALRSA